MPKKLKNDINENIAMRKTLAEIAAIVDGEIVGDPNLIITGISGIKEANPGDLTFIANSKYTSLSRTTKASAILAPLEAQIKGKTIIRTENPSLAFAQVASATVKEETFHPKGIHKTAIISKKAVIAKNAAIGPYVVIEDGVNIGENTAIYAGSYIGHCTVIGRGCLVYPNVTIRERVIIGDQVTIHSGTVIGSDGFGYVWVNGKHEKISQIGTVVIESDVEIGSNVTIDRARFDKTVIGEGTKIDNLVQIAHNVILGKHCIIISQVGISGSAIIEDGVILAGQAGVNGHVTVGKGVKAFARAGITKSIAPNTSIAGYPAQPYMDEQRFQASLRLIPKYLKIISDLKKRVETLEKKIKK